MKAKISLGLPSYGGISAEWTTQTMQFVANLAMEHNLMDIISIATMTADHSRNMIVDEFLKSESEWLFWIDADTLVPVGAVNRMLAHGKELVSGLYYGKNPPHVPIAYTVYNGAFRTLSEERKWEKGEIISVDAVGMGCMLTHRSVFEDIKKNYTVYQIPGGGVTPIYNNDILGAVNPEEKHEHDGKVYKGQWRQRLVPVTIKNLRFPFFMVDHCRTEDMFFFDLAKRVGYTPVLDTSVECGHLRNVPFGGKDFRQLEELQRQESKVQYGE